MAIRRKLLPTAMVATMTATWSTFGCVPVRSNAASATPFRREPVDNPHGADPDTTPSPYLLGPQIQVLSTTSS
jgi:hypothetical protein